MDGDRIRDDVRTNIDGAGNGGQNAMELRNVPRNSIRRTV